MNSDTRFRSLLKAVSWRCVGTLDTFLVSFLVLHLTNATEGAGEAVKISGGIASVEVITKVMLYYFHERAWARIRVGRRPRLPEVSERAVQYSQ